MGFQCHKTPQVKICTEQTTNCTADVASSCGNDEVDDNSPGPPWATKLVRLVLCGQCNRFACSTCHTCRTYLPVAAAVASAGLRLPRCSNTPWLPCSCMEDIQMPKLFPYSMPKTAWLGVCFRSAPSRHPTSLVLDFEGSEIESRLQGGAARS